MRTHVLIFIIGGFLFLSGSYFWISSIEKNHGDPASGVLSDLKSAASQTFSGRRLVAEVVPYGGEDNLNVPARESEKIVFFDGPTSKPLVPKEIFCKFSENGVPTHTPIIFSEIAWMGDDKDSTNEWIEIYNTSDKLVSIGGFQIIDKDEQIKISLPDISLAAGEYYVFSRNVDMEESRFNYFGNLRNSDEGIKLFDSDCALLDNVFAAPTWPAGDIKEKLTMERNFSDLSWYSSAVSLGTPGGKNSYPVVATPIKTEVLVVPTTTVLDPVNQNTEFTPPDNVSSAPKIFITEVMAGKADNADYEFVELWNDGETSVDLTGWSIKKKTSTGSESALVSSAVFKGKNISPKSYFLIADASKYDGPVVADLLWPASYSLAYTRNSISLISPDGLVVDSVSWEEIPKDQSYTKISPNGGIFQLSVPTPRN